MQRFNLAFFFLWTDEMWYYPPKQAYEDFSPCTYQPTLASPGVKVARDGHVANHPTVGDQAESLYFLCSRLVNSSQLGLHLSFEHLTDLHFSLRSPTRRRKRRDPPPLLAGLSAWRKGRAVCDPQTG